ncbi:MAG: hypothetical protein JWM99_4881 [Verrucomicrobiales bacterium]|nr:hypothetical protein [Verrucomicrobiales bacterium]
MNAKIKAAVKALLLGMFPHSAAQVFSVRSRAYSQAFLKEAGCVELNTKMLHSFGNRVLHGPFSGVVLSAETHCEHITPFLLGTYESELAEMWLSIFQRRFTQILDVGAKFGFYAVGLAQRFPEVPVVAFDIDPWARKAVHAMSRANGVKVQVQGFCDPQWMCRHLKKNAFILSDCEGYEATLFGADIPNADSATMLVELHEEVSPGVTRLLQVKYSCTHEISIIPAVGKPTKYPIELNGLSEEERTMAVSEYRAAEQCWMFFQPRSRAGLNGKMS